MEFLQVDEQLPLPQEQIATPPPLPLTPDQVAVIRCHYFATVTEVHDGDTATIEICLGLGDYRKGEAIRIARINAAELSTQEGKKAGDYLRGLLTGKEIIIKTFNDKREKYGRLLVEVWMQDTGGSYVNVNDLMVQAGYAAGYTGGKRG